VQTNTRIAVFSGREISIRVLLSCSGWGKLWGWSICEGSSLE